MLSCSRTSQSFSLTAATIAETAHFRITTNSFAETLYKIGIFLSRPLFFEMNQGAKLFYHMRPGKNFNTLTLQSKVWKILKVASLFTVAVPLIALILAALGFIFKRIAACFRPEAFLLRNKMIRNLDFPEDMSLHIMTYNMSLFPKYQSTKEHLRSPNQRAREIGEWLRKSDNESNPHILCAQGCFDPKATEILCEILKKEYPYIVYGVDPNASENGLLVASRFEITALEYKNFDNSNKGSLAIHLKVGREHFNVVNTELDARANVRSNMIFSDQVTELCNFVRSTCNEKPTFVAGDFNLPHLSEIAIPNLKQTHQLLGDEFANFFYTDHNENGQKINGNGLTPGGRYNKDLSWGNPNWTKSTIINSVESHIFSYRVKLEKTKVETSIQDAKEKGQISGASDHLPLFAKISNFYL